MLINCQVRLLNQSTSTTLPSIFFIRSSLLSFSSWSQIMENSLVSSSSFFSLRASVTRYVSWMISLSLPLALSVYRQISLSSSMVQLQIWTKSYLGHKAWLQIFLIRLRFSGSSPYHLLRWVSTFFINSSKNIFITVKSFLNFSMIFSLKELLTNSWYSSSVKALLLILPSLSRMQDLQVIMHCHLDNTKMKISAFQRGMWSFQAANKLWILRERWLRKTALLRLNKNQFLILRMVAFFISVCSYFWAMDLQRSWSLDSVASVEATIVERTFYFLSSCLVISISWMIFLSSKQIWFIFWDISSLSLENISARFMLSLMSLLTSFFTNNQFSKISFQEMRSSGSNLSIFYSSVWRSSFLSFWGNLMSFLLTLEMSYSRLAALWGVLPQSIWQKMTPMDQTSLLVEQVLPLRIQGHMYMGLPTRDWWICYNSEPSWQYLAKPKSAILQISSLMRMLAGLRSRWMTECQWRYLQPSMSCFMMMKAQFQGSFLRFSSTSSREPLLHSSWNKQMLLEDFLTSYNSTMLSFLMDFMISISFLRDSQNFYGSFLMLEVEMVLTATSCPVRMSAPLKTQPYDPLPILSLMLMMKGQTNLQQEVPSLAASYLIFCILFLSII